MNYGYTECQRCLYPASHPLGIVIDDEGICSGCRIHEEKDTLDWDARWKRLSDLIQPYRIIDGKTHDCIVPVTGGNDSYFIVHVVKHLLGLNPLLVTYNKYYNTPLGIWNLANLRRQFDCDILVQNVNPVSVRNITRTTLRELGSIYWHCIAGQTVFPVQTAITHGIPLIIWGAHQGLEQVGMFSHEHEIEMTRRYRKDHDLMGYEADDLLSIFDTLSEDDIWQYRYPDDASLSSASVRGIYLGNFVRWDPKAQHELMMKRYGYRTAQFARTFDCYDHVDCYNFMDLHDHIKYLKQGYSKVTDHACREIRHGRLTREQARQLVTHHERQPLQHRDKWLTWLGMEKNALRFVLDQHRRPDLFEQTEPGQWSRREKAIDAMPGELPVAGFRAVSTLANGEADRYVVIGKGYP